MLTVTGEGTEVREETWMEVMRTLFVQSCSRMSELKIKLCRV